LRYWDFVRHKIVDAAFVVVLLVGFSLFVTGWNSPDVAPGATTTSESTTSTTVAPAGSCESVSIAVAPTTVARSEPAGTTSLPSRVVSAAVALPSVVRGQVQTGYAYGFRPGEPVTASLPAAGCGLGTAIADSDGSVALAWTVGAEESLGNHEFVVSGETGTATAPFRVVIDEPVTTGGVGQPLLLLVLAVVGLGALIYVLTIRWAKVKSEFDGCVTDDRPQPS
jgi:hypothetical protein